MNDEKRSAAAETAPPTTDQDALVIEIARELYDRFVMGGWEPQDAYPQIRGWLGLTNPSVSTGKDGGMEDGHAWAENTIGRASDSGSNNRGQDGSEATRSVTGAPEAAEALQAAREKYVDALYRNVVARHTVWHVSKAQRGDWYRQVAILIRGEFERLRATVEELRRENQELRKESRK